MSLHTRWAFDITKWQPTPNAILRATSFIQGDEKTRLARFHFRDDFNSSIIGRLMMRKLLYSHPANKIPYQDLKFGRNEKNKPILIHPVDLSQNTLFNVSHHGRYTVIAGAFFNHKNHQESKNFENNFLGVDVMRRRDIPPHTTLDEYFKLMRNTFSHFEWESIRAAPNDPKSNLGVFTRLWCLKESYLKALGVGITVDLASVSFQLRTDLVETGLVVKDTVLWINGTRSSNWYFEEQMIDEEHYVAVALCGDAVVEGNGERVFEVIDFERVTRGAEPLLEEDQDYCDAYFKKPLKILS